jgi:adenosylmethionine---8-amino-7-oxononanoate aminotransferase
VTDVRTRGAIGVVELEPIEDLNALRSAFVAKGAFIRPIGNAIYLAPALTIGEEDVAFLTRVIGEVLRERAAGHSGARA